MSAITFTVDLEDHRPDASVAPRYPAATRAILEHLDRTGTKATFFVVGVVAAAAPELIREIAAAGHEVALHCWQHIPLVEHDAASFRADITKGKAFLEDLTGAPVVGYRAPTFSLVASTTWAPALLTEAGFTYSSSVLPTANPLYGFPEAPADAFLWPCGLAEFPVPIAGIRRIAIPYLGGTYLRVLPSRVIQLALARSPRRVPWAYLHPYDTDTGERYWVVPDAGPVMSPLLWVGRRRVLAKLDRLLDAGAGAVGGAPGLPLRDRVDEARLGPVFAPPVPAPAPIRTPSAEKQAYGNW
jgi:polysaccharide deacetylase family protein (PEP-CTERM system associated)